MPKTKKETNKETKIDKKKIEKEITEEIKATITEEVQKIIERETQNKLDKMEKKINRYKVVALRKRDIIIFILLVLIFFETKVLFENDFLEYVKRNNNIHKNYDTKEILKDEAWYMNNYSYLVDNIKTNLNEEGDLYLYKKSYEAKDIDNKIRLNMSYQLLESDDISNSNSVITIEESKLKEAYKKLFGSYDNYKSENFTNDCIQYIYNERFHTFMAIDMNCQEKTKEIKREITKIKEENDKILITVLVATYNKESSTVSTIDGTLVEGAINISNLIDYQDQLNEYKFTFNKKDNNYYLESITKTK